MMAIDVQRARHEMPGGENVLHSNNAGAVSMPQPVLYATVAHLQRSFLEMFGLGERLVVAYQDNGRSMNIGTAPQRHVILAVPRGMA
jgi:hypothetical protein